MAENQPLEFVYVCHPYGGEFDNLMAAEEICREIREKNPHLIPVFVPRMFHGLIDDKDPVQRAAALQFCLKLIQVCNHFGLFKDTLSIGMKGELKHAACLNFPIRYGEEFGIETKREEKP